MRAVVAQRNGGETEKMREKMGATRALPIRSIVSNQIRLKPGSGNPLRNIDMICIGLHTIVLLAM